MDALTLFNLKVLSLLLLGYLITLWPQVRSLLVGYGIFSLAAPLVVGTLQEGGRTERAVYRALTALPAPFARELAWFDQFYPILVGGLAALLVLWFLFHRHALPRVRELVKKYLAIRVTKDGANLSARKITFDAERYFTMTDGSGTGYLVGLDTKRKPVRLAEADLAKGVQVVGPPGQGKSVLLLNMAVQAVQRGRAVCFVDGKGDMGFLEDLRGHVAALPSQNQPLVFSPLSPESSHTYNPLAAIEDPAELADMVASGLNLNVPGAGRVYSDTQKAYLILLFRLFLETGKTFNFPDIMTFTDFPDARSHVYDLVPNRRLVDDMENFFRRLAKNESELLGLTALIQKLFCMDPAISRLVNSYSSDIAIKEVFEKQQLCVFSLSAGKKAETNEALAKMVIADVANAVGERMARGPAANEFGLLLLDEFGQYVPDNFDKFISTARGAKVGCVLSHQSNSQLISRDGVNRLAPIVRECSNTTILFRQAEEADFWARVIGTITSVKRTDVIEKGRFWTEKIAPSGSVREVEEFIIHPNKLKQLDVGQVAYKSGDSTATLVSVGMLKRPSGTLAVAVATHKPAVEGLELRKRLESGRRVPIEAPAAAEQSAVGPTVELPAAVETPKERPGRARPRTIRL